MSCTDWSNALLIVVILATLMAIAIHKSPKAKKRIGTRLVASAEADEERSRFYADRLTDLRHTIDGAPKFKTPSPADLEKWGGI